jgi:hypothetical protein
LYGSGTLYGRGHTYITKYLPGVKRNQPMLFGGKIWKGDEKKGENARQNGRKGKEKGRRKKKK